MSYLECYDTIRYNLPTYHDKLVEIMITNETDLVSAVEELAHRLVAEKIK